MLGNDCRGESSLRVGLITSFIAHETILLSEYSSTATNYNYNYNTCNNGMDHPQRDHMDYASDSLYNIVHYKI